MRRSIVTPRKGWYERWGRYWPVFLIIASSLPVFASDEPSKRILFSYNGTLLDVPSSQGPLYGLALVVLYAIALAGNTIKALYGARIGLAEYITDVMWFFPTPVRTARGITLAAVSSYALTIWSYGLAYYFLVHRVDCHLFNAPANDTVFTWLYFSLVTMATVGFGEITPQTDWARALVSSEIILGVAYQIFFFSIVASFVRENARGSSSLRDR